MSNASEGATEANWGHRGPMMIWSARVTNSAHAEPVLKPFMRRYPASVRGTAWRVHERCDGTLTRITSGSVLVTDLTKDRTVVVRAGRSHLARP